MGTFLFSSFAIILKHRGDRGTGFVFHLYDSFLLRFYIHEIQTECRIFFNDYAYPFSAKPTVNHSDSFNR